MTNVRRPIHLHLRPGAGVSPFSHLGSAANSLVASTPIVTNTSARTPVRPNALMNSNSLTSQRAHPRPTAPAPHQQHRQQQQQNPQSHSNSKPLSPSGDLNEALPTQILPHLFVGAQEQTNRETVNKLDIKYILSLGLLPIVLASAHQHSSAQVLVSSSTASPSRSPASHTIGQAASDKEWAGAAGAADATDTTQTFESTRQLHKALMPSRNCSRDFKIRIRSNTPTPTPTPTQTSAAPATANNSTQSPHSFNCPSTPTQVTSAPNTANANANANNNNNNNHNHNNNNNNNTENKGVKAVRSIRCKCINISDHSDQLLMRFFDETCAFIDEARRKKCNILVHCLAGISRSPTIAIAYLMRARSLHWRDAYDMVKQCRPQIDPNLNFMGQLRIYNKSLRDQQAARGGGELTQVDQVSAKLSAEISVVTREPIELSDEQIRKRANMQTSGPDSTTATSTTTNSKLASTKTPSRHSNDDSHGR